MTISSTTSPTRIQLYEEAPTPPQSPHKRSRSETLPEFFKWLKELEFSPESGTLCLTNRLSHYSYDALSRQFSILESVTANSINEFSSLMAKKFSWNEDTTLANWRLLQLENKPKNVDRAKKIIEKLDSFTSDDTILDLAKMNLAPPPVFHFDKYKNLTELNLSINRLKDLPESLHTLTDLTDLSLDDNYFPEFPNSLQHLTWLKRLSLISVNLTEIPEYFGKFISLETLDVGTNQLTCLPKAMEGCTSLKNLYLDDNEFSEMPDVVSQLTSLEELTMAENELTELPELNALTNLKRLDLGVNPLWFNAETDEDFDLSRIEKLTNLTELNLDSNLTPDNDFPEHLLKGFPYLS